MRRSSALQDFYRYKFRIDKRDLALDLCDNPGQAEYRRLIWAAARNCKAFILMFDLSSSLSFEEAKQWLAELR
jgi:GTPase SAR1 family protein